MTHIIKIAQWGQIHSLYLPLYVAMEEGFFAHGGLSVDLQLAGNDDEIFAAVAKGEADFGVGDPTFCAMKKNEPLHMKVIATLVGKAGFWGLTQNAVIPVIKKPADMVNLRIGTSPRPSTNFSLIQEIKEQNKRLLKSMTIIEAPIGHQFDLLAEGKADIVMDIEPFVSIAESKGFRIVYSYPDIHGACVFTGLYTLCKTIDETPKIVCNTVQAVDAALKAIHADPDIALRVSGKLFPTVKKSILKKSVQRLLGANVWQSTTNTEKTGWATIIKTRQHIGDDFTKDIYACLENKFTKQVCTKER